MGPPLLVGSQEDTLHIIYTFRSSRDAASKSITRHKQRAKIRLYLEKESIISRNIFLLIWIMCYFGRLLRKWKRSLSSLWRERYFIILLDIRGRLESTDKDYLFSAHKLTSRNSFGGCRRISKVKGINHHLSWVTLVWISVETPPTITMCWP